MIISTLQQYCPACELGFSASMLYNSIMIVQNHAQNDKLKHMTVMFIHQVYICFLPLLISVIVFDVLISIHGLASEFEKTWCKQKCALHLAGISYTAQTSMLIPPLTDGFSCITRIWCCRMMLIKVLQDPTAVFEQKYLTSYSRIWSMLRQAAIMLEHPTPA